MSFRNAGTIELTELKQVMLQLGQNPAEEDLIEMMRLVDVNGDNEIDFEEFLVMMTMRSGERDTEADGEAETEAVVDADTDEVDDGVTDEDGEGDGDGVGETEDDTEDVPDGDAEAEGE